MAKLANVFGRLEAFSISVFLYVIGYIQMAGSNNVETFASAYVFSELMFPHLNPNMGPQACLEGSYSQNMLLGSIYLLRRAMLTAKS